MQFSPPFAEDAGDEHDFERDRQNTNVDQNLNNPNLRTGTLWFNPQNNEINSSANELGAANIDIGPEGSGHQRKLSQNIDPDEKPKVKKRRKKSLK